jgi:hypothetical protein
MSASIQTDNLFKAQGLFIEAMRSYVISVLLPTTGDHWPARFFACLGDKQRDSWNEGLRNGSSPTSLIDFGHLRGFAITHKDLLRKDFGRSTGDLATTFGKIAEVRHKNMHFKAITPDEYTMAFINMTEVARQLNMTDLVAELETLRQPAAPVAEARQPAAVPAVVDDKPLPWFSVVRPHLDIRQGQLDESVFAANLAEVALGNGREIYLNPAVFFSKTYFTLGLKTIARRVMKGLNGQEDAENRVISLQTGFGGGKTHTLISLYHLARLGRQLAQSAVTKPLLDYTGDPTFESARLAVFTNTTNDAASGRIMADGTHLHTMWGELAYQLGGKEAYELVRKNDESLIAPAGVFRKVLEQFNPALILVDELTDYCVKASARVVGASTLADQTISFMQELSEAVAGTNHCVLVATLPVSVTEVAQSEKASQILTSLTARLSRVGADTKPVADEEIYEVIRRRLFDDIGDPMAIETTVEAYITFYQSLKSALPTYATQTVFREKLLKSYPFHPELIDLFRVRWASHHDFQRTRGVLRLLASIVSDLWQRQQNLTNSLLIHPSDVNFTNLDALSGQLKKLYGNGYDAVISADVSGTSSNAFNIDQEKADYGRWQLTQGVAATILLGSFGSDGTNKGQSVAELKLSTLKPNSFNHNSINGALDELESRAHYLYYNSSGSNGKRYWFHTKPNINILINQGKNDISVSDTETEILKRINERVRHVEGFTVLVNPSDDVPEQQKPTIIILSPKYTANPTKVNGLTKPFIEKIATKRGNSDRIYRNTLLFLVCSEISVDKLNACVKEYLACHKINLEYGGQLEKDQREDIKRRIEEASRQVDIAVVTAYSIVLKYATKHGFDSLVIKQFQDTLDRQLNTYIIGALKEEDGWLLDSIGMATLQKNNLLPTPDRPVRVKDIYEAFLRFDDKPMITGPGAVQHSIQRYYTNNAFAIATGESAPFTRYFSANEQPTVPYFDILDPTYWLVDKSTIPAKPAPAYVGPADLPGNEKKEVKEVPASIIPPDQSGTTPTAASFNSITISGKVPLERYTELFQYFITPFAMTGNKIEIEVSFKVHGSESSPLNESKQQYKSAKEAAKQLGLTIRED